MRSDFSLNKVTTEFSLCEREKLQYTMIGVTRYSPSVGKGKSRPLLPLLLFLIPIQRIVLATEETSMTERVSRRPINMKCQPCSW